MRTWGRRLLVTLGAVALGGSVWAQSLPFAGLSEAEQGAILRGESVFRIPSGWRNLAVPADAPFAASIIQEIRDSGANYVGEVLMMVPAKGVPDLPARLARALAAVEGYVGIPYYSKRNKITVDLFDRMKVESRSGTADSGRVVAEQHMDPFEPYKASYEWGARPDGLSFRSENLSPLAFKGTKAVTPGAMVWRIEAYRRDGMWVLYGLGRVKAFDMFGLLRDRLETSFMGRIEAFYSYMFKKAL